jgi:cytidyltransferase-like protein
MSNGVGVFYGRMNPFTKGHKAAINHIKSLGLKPIIIVTHTFNAEKNPLNVNEKIKVIKNSLKNKNIEIFATSSKDPKLHTILNTLKKRGNTNIRVFLGANRIKGIGQYVLKSGYTPVQFGGNRNIVGNSLAGVSGTRARMAALSGNKATFSKMMSPILSPKTVNSLMKTIKTRMTVKK